jgi:type IV pilus assembly protein PilA
MFKALKKKLKDQRGLTLIELLAVVVILGIIAAIAVPSIGGLIDNTKKDAHVANAQVMVNATKLAITTDTNLQKTGIAPAKHTSYVTLQYLISKNFIDEVKSPDTEDYVPGSDLAVNAAFPTDVPTTGSYVTVTDGKVTAVKLVTSKRGVQDAGAAVLLANLKRGAVKEIVAGP